MSNEPSVDGPNPQKMFRGRGLDLVKPLDNYCWSVHSSKEGAKLAFLNMKLLSEKVSSCAASQSPEQKSRISSFKRYLIYDTYHYESIEAALEKLPLYIYTSLKLRCVGCLLIKDSQYLFFWLKA